MRGYINQKNKRRRILLCKGRGERRIIGRGYERRRLLMTSLVVGARPELERDTTEKKHSVSKTGHNHDKHTTSRRGDLNTKGTENTVTPGTPHNIRQVKP